MKSIETLRTEILELPQNEPVAHLNYYRSQQLTILSINPNESENHFQAKLQTLHIYGKLLVNNGNYHDAHDILNKSKEVIESNPFKSVNLKEDSKYRQIIFDFSRACYHTKRLSTAKEHLERLLELDPSNDMYKNWKSGVSLEKFNKLDKVLMWTFATWVIMDIFLQDTYPNIFDTLWYTYLGVTIFITSMGILLYKKRIQKKIQSR